MSRGEKGFVILVGGLVLIPILGLIASLTIGWDAGLIGRLGTGLWLMSVFLWIVFRDSRRKWPEASTFQRYVNVITFKR